MAWTWIFTDLQGTPVQDLPAAAVLTPFPSQADAETWLGESWQIGRAHV